MSTHVLIVEDEPMLREMLALEFRDQGIPVEIVTDGDEAIQSIEARVPQMCLLDLLMPRRDGYAVLQHIRRRGFTFPVIVLSNLGSPEEERKCREFGALDFIVKSQLDTKELWERIQPYFLALD